MKNVICLFLLFSPFAHADQIALTLLKNGTYYWGPSYFNTQADADRWLNELKTSPDWNPIYTIRIDVRIDPPFVAPTPDPDVVAAQTALKSFDKTKIKDNGAANAIVDLIKALRMDK